MHENILWGMENASKDDSKQTLKQPIMQLHSNSFEK